MKKLFVLFLISALLLICASATENTVFVSDGGSGDGSSESSPLGSLDAAYAALGENGGTIHVVDTLTLTSNFTEPTHTGTVTVTGGKLAINDIRYLLNGPTTFENIKMHGDGNFFHVIAQFNPIVFGEGIEVSGFGTFATASKSIAIIGGVHKDYDRYEDSSLYSKDPSITVKSGKAFIIAFSRNINKTFSGTAYVNLEGGEFSKIYFGSSNGTGNNAVVNISGGTFLKNIYATDTGSNCHLVGNFSMRISGGDFTSTELTLIDGTVKEGKTSVADVTGFPRYAYLVEKMEGFQKIITDEGELFPGQQVETNDAFAYGSFTASDGTVIPYRYYLPVGYETSGKDYPVFLYMHGNGSRGSDNQLQLTSSGTPLQSAIFASKYECIMLAPQCPSASEWTINASIGVNTYPGTKAYADFLESGNPYPSRYFCAAAELLDMFISEYNVDTSRIYVHGTSNGGGAVWNLVALYPEVFAAAVPVAGGNADPDYVHAIASRYKDVPIWAFHGDSDTTVPVGGTRAIVSAVKEIGGEVMKYTEVVGGTHGNIWKIAAQTDGLIDWIFEQKNDNFENTISKKKGPKLGTTAKLFWNDDVATWNAVENAGAYKVSFYVDGVFEKAYFTPNTTFTPDASILNKGECTFTVRAFTKDNANTPGAESPASRPYGSDFTDIADFDGSGDVTAIDVMLLIDAVVNNAEIGGNLSGDINGDGKIGLRDILILIEYITE